MTKNAALIATMLLFVAGCTTVERVENRASRIDKRFEETVEQVQQYQSSRGQHKPETVKYVDNQWVSLKPAVVRRAEQPVNLRCRVRMVTDEPVTLLEVGQIITRECGIAVRVTPDALSAISNPIPSSQAARQGLQQNAPPLTMGGLPPSETNNKIDINFKGGEIGAFLDMVTARFGLQWRAEDEKRVTIYDLDTETFNLYAIASSVDMSSTLETGTSMVNGRTTSGAGAAAGVGGDTSSGIGGTSGSNQRTEVGIRTNIWDDVKATLDGMKSHRGTVVTSPATGTIVVTDNAEALARIRAYVRKINANLTRQVVFNVRLVAVSNTARDQLGISWNAVVNTVSQKYGLEVVSGAGAIAGATNIRFSVAPGSGSRLAGTDAILSALAEQGSVSVVRAPSASTLNLRPVSLQIAQQTTFLAGSTTTQTPQVGTTSSIQLGQVTHGFNMSFIPQLMEDDRMLLQFSINLSNIAQRRTVTSGDAQAEAIDLSMPINSVQQVKLRAGETLVLAGFDQDDESVDRSGTNTPRNMFLGGGANGNRNRTALVLLITPAIQD